MFRLLFIPGFLLFQFSAICQKAQLRINVNQEDLIVHLNGVKQTVNESLPLEQGTYLLESWAPTYQYFKDTISLKAGVDTIITITLSHSSAFLNYEKDLRKYRFQSISMRYIAPSAYLGVMAFQMINLNNRRKTLDLLQADALATKNRYETAVDPKTISIEADNYEMLKNQYNIEREVMKSRQQAALTSGIVLGLVVIALETVAFRLEKPEFSEETRLSFQPYFSGNAAGIAITWP